MVKAANVEKLRAALAQVLLDRSDGAPKVTLDEVCKAAKVGRATAYRGTPCFADEFKAALAASDTGAAAIPPDPVGADGMKVPTASTPKKRGGGEAATRKLQRAIAILANQVQALTLELERERRRERPAPAPVAEGDNVVPIDAGEPLRVFRRLQFLRDWSS